MCVWLFLKLLRVIGTVPWCETHQKFNSFFKPTISAIYETAGLISEPQMILLRKLLQRPDPMELEGLFSFLNSMFRLDLICNWKIPKSPR